MIFLCDFIYRMSEENTQPPYDPSKDPKRKANSSDPAWKYGFWPEIIMIKYSAHFVGKLFVLE